MFSNALRSCIVIILSIMSTTTQAVSTSKLQIHIPSSLSLKDGYDHRDALFGIPPYGGSIQETMYYTTDKYCGFPTPSAKSFPNLHGKSYSSPFILMIDRGDCTFVQKVRNAQKAGAAAVLIADNECQCSAVDCVTAAGSTCESQEPIMADDGSGSDISIPSFLVFKQDADKIKAEIMKNTPVRVEMSFSVPNPDARVEYDLWMTPKDPVSRTFLKTFKEAAIALGDKAYFTPRHYVYDGVRAGCQDHQGNNVCFSLCTNEGRYCSTDPDDDMTSGISGANLVEESLRRTCIWKLYGEEDGVGSAWWDYVSEFMARCDSFEEPALFTSQQCILDAMVNAGIDHGKVVKCMKDSGGTVDNVPNTIFDAQLSDKETAGAFLIPSMFINQVPIRGELVFATVFRAICSGYATGHEPTICQQCATCNDEVGCVEMGGKCSSGRSAYGMDDGVTKSTFVTSLGVLSLFFIIVGYYQYRRQQNIMNDQIRGIVAEYMPVGSQNLSKDNTLGFNDDDDEGFT